MKRELRDRVAGGVAWSIAEKAGSMLLQMAVSIVVARLLSPEDFGVMAILTVFSSLALVVVDSGFSQTLIRKSDPSPDELSSVFRFNLTAAVALYLLLVAVSPSVARFYGRPELARIAPALFLLLPVNALGVIQNTLMVRRFRFALLSKITFAAQLAGGAIAVVMALSGLGVWSLVGQRVGMMCVRTALLWFAGERRLDGRFDRRALREMAPFSLRLLATDLISSLYNNISSLFIGKIYSTDMLGYFNQGQKLKELPVTSTIQAVQNVTYPALSSLGDKPRKLAESFRQIVMITAFVMFPAMTGLIAVADDLFALLLGDKWMPAVPYFKILCLSGLFMPLATIALNVLKVRSDGGVIVRLEIVKKALMTVILALAIPTSVTAIAWGLSAMALIEVLLNTAAALRYSGLRLSAFVRSLAPAALCAAAMFGAVRLFALSVDCVLPLRLAGEVLVGVAVYLLLASVLGLEAIKIVCELLRRQLSERSA